MNFHTKLTDVIDRLQWLPGVVARFNIGLFFAISGYNKLFTPANQAAMLATMHDANIPFPEFNAVFVALVELVVGATLAAGLLCRLSTVPLLIITLVATFTHGIYAIPAGLGPLDWYDWFLYLPETLLILLLLWLSFANTAALSVDRMLARQPWRHRKTG